MKTLPLLLVLVLFVAASPRSTKRGVSKHNDSHPKNATERKRQIGYDMAPQPCCGQQQQQNYYPQPPQQNYYTAPQDNYFAIPVALPPVPQNPYGGYGQQPPPGPGAYGEFPPNNGKPGYPEDEGSYNTTPEPRSRGKSRMKYPLPQCYTNDDRYMCCNAKLEDLMDALVDSLKNEEHISCDTQKIANRLQGKAELRFGMPFEAIVGLGDFVSKTHFYRDLVCKIKRNGRVILVYATPNRHNNHTSAVETNAAFI